ncbi:MAG: M23 family metallopeptidase [Gammaproteobacteria bacterium]|nr:M23 family metallopeptidase [Gammaproteobacteria bacterium]
MPQQTVTPDPEVQARIAEDNRKIGQARAVNSDRLDFTGEWIWPAEGRISGVYGSQRILNGEPRAPHWGIDIAAPTGTPVYAPAAGVVRLAEPDLVLSGGTIIVDHGHDIFSSFLHLHAIHVAVGDEIAPGDLIGEIGATGRATGPHLDWRMNWGSTRIDPQLLLPERD